MNNRSFQVWISATFQVGISAIALALLLVSCGGGGHNTNDTNPFAPPVIATSVFGPNSFLLFPNPLSKPAIDSPEYSQTYYNTIDPNNERDTLAKWKAKNGFGMAGGVEQQAVFGDVRDLGYGRHVTARWNDDGTWAFMVDNYSVGPAADYAYSNLNLQAAIAQDKRWYVGTNAIEISAGPGCPPPLTPPIINSTNKTPCRIFAKFFNFNAETGARQLEVDLDGRGNKAMPGVCLTCHGGRGDEILRASVNENIASASYGATIPAQFPLFGNPASEVRGDVKGKLHAFEVDTFDFDTQSGFTRADQEAGLKVLNEWVLDTYPLPTGTTLFGASAVYPEDQDRDVAQANEWQGQAADVIKAAYGGNGMQSPTYSDTYVPSSWIVAGQTDLYNKVVKSSCRICHLLRGLAQQSDVSFDTFQGFQAYADKIKYHVIDRGNMPLSRIVNDRFWATPSMYTTLNQFLQASNVVAGSAVSFSVTDSTGNQLKPGRPVADFGPSRLIGTSSTQLSAQWSLYADTFSWSIVSNPGSAASLSNSTGAQTTFTATSDGTYVVQLIASKGGVQSDPVTSVIVVNSAAWPTAVSGIAGSTYPLPSAIRFSDIRVVLQKNCVTCHTASPIAALGDKYVPPILYTNVDRNGDGLVQSGVNSTDDQMMYDQVLSFVNFSDISSSQLLRHPAGYTHAGGVQVGFGTSVRGATGISADQYLPGNVLRDAYDMFINWILNGAPYQ